MKNLLSDIKGSLLATILIGFGVAVLLAMGNPLGPFLFAFGLLGVCTLQGVLYTGKAGYMWRQEPIRLLLILIFNLIFGWLVGFLISAAAPDLMSLAAQRMETWSWSSAFFIKSIFCGMIMYIAVDMYKQHKNIAGIIYGIPLFIFCGFQHSIANVIIAGIARNFSFTIIYAAIGNLIGSIIINLLTKGVYTNDLCTNTIEEIFGTCGSETET